MVSIDCVEDNRSICALYVIQWMQERRAAYLYKEELIALFAHIRVIHVNSHVVSSQEREEHVTKVCIIDSFSNSMMSINNFLRFSLLLKCSLINDIITNICIEDVKDIPLHRCG